VSSKVVTQGDIFGMAYKLDLRRMALAPLDRAVAPRASVAVAQIEDLLEEWRKPAFEGVEALLGKISKVEYYDLATSSWKEWTETVARPIGTEAAIRCTMKNDSGAKIGMKVDFYVVDPDGGVISDPGPYVGVNAGDTLISEDYRFKIDKAGVYEVVFYLWGRI